MCAFVCGVCACVRVCDVCVRVHVCGFVCVVYAYADFISHFDEIVATQDMAVRRDKMQNLYEHATAFLIDDLKHMRYVRLLASVRLIAIIHIDSTHDRR